MGILQIRKRRDTYERLSGTGTMETGKGVRYIATVSYADGTAQQVRVNTPQIYEKAQIGQHAVVVWFLDRKGNPRKYPYSLNVI